jgi:hypothetical protein
LQCLKSPGGEGDKFINIVKSMTYKNTPVWHPSCISIEARMTPRFQVGKRKQRGRQKP